jgi:NADPH:quinone reductase-like Zn-dependent oxidoreductase
LGHVARLRLASLRSSAKAVFFVAKLTRADLEVLAEMLEAGTVTPVVDKRFALSEIVDAFEYLGEGHARAKVVVDF